MYWWLTQVRSWQVFNNFVYSVRDPKHCGLRPRPLKISENMKTSTLRANVADFKIELYNLVMT